MLRFADSFDHYSSSQILNKWSGTRSGGSWPSSGGRFGNCWPPGARYSWKQLDAQGTWIIGSAVYPVLGTAGTVYAWYDPIAAGYQISLRWNGSQFVVCRDHNGTVLGTSAAIDPIAVWKYLEFKVVIHNSTGSFEVRLDGVNILSGSSLDTQNTANATASLFYIGRVDDGGAACFEHDDLYVCDGTGSRPTNSFLGDVRVEALFPNGNGNYSQLDGSDGNNTNNYLLVDETSPNDDTDYVESSDVGDKDTYTYTDLTSTSGTVYGVQVLPYARKTDAGTRKIASVARLSGTDADSADSSLFTSYTYLPDIRETKPGGGTWSISDVNSAEFGTKVTA